MGFTERASGWNISRRKIRGGEAEAGVMPMKLTPRILARRMSPAYTSKVRDEELHQISTGGFSII